MSNPIKVLPATSEEEKEQLFAIRHEVFVVEQQVSREDEFDEFEETAHHFIAYVGDEPAGAARWRETDKGVKLERFAVKKDFRGKGVASEVLKAVLEDIQSTLGGGQYLYLHAQLTAIPLYSKFDFKKTGPQFEECNIQHFKMERYI